MKAVALLVNVEKLAASQEVGRLAREAVALLEARGIAVVVNQESAARLGRLALGMPEPDLPARAEMIVVFGGDGTILRAARAAAPRGIPILGVNAGGFGFLAEVHDLAVADALLRVLAGDYRLDERMMLRAAVHRGERVAREFLALNDVVITKSGYARLLQLRTDVNGDHLATHLADGLIVATPTGSTAYSLSAGGPIIHPIVDAIVLTPICAHTLNARAVVISGGDVVAVAVQPTGAPSILTVDGQEGVPLEADDVVRIERSAHRTRLVRLGRTGFYGLLRAKLSWAERPAGAAGAQDEGGRG